MLYHVIKGIAVHVGYFKNSGDVGLRGFPGDIGLAPLTPMTGLKSP